MRTSVPVVTVWLYRRLIPVFYCALGFMSHWLMRMIIPILHFGALAPREWLSSLVRMDG